MKIIGIQHIELTVSDLNRSKDFYSLFPDFKIVASYPNFIMFYAGSFYFGLTDHRSELGEKVFNEKNVGLDHLAFELDSLESLGEAKEFLINNGIVHSEIKKLSNGSYIITFRDPDNIQLEFCYKK
jgi:glyoxylase I family protein